MQCQLTLLANSALVASAADFASSSVLPEEASPPAEDSLPLAPLASAADDDVSFSDEDAFESAADAPRSTACEGEGLYFVINSIEVGTNSITS